MPYLMSFARTWEQFRSGQKDVTRRGGYTPAQFQAFSDGIDAIEGVEWSPRVGQKVYCLEHGPINRPICPSCPVCGQPLILRREPERLPGRMGWRRVVSKRWEALGEITAEDVAREGFPGRSPEWFIEFYCAPKPPNPGLLVHRIEFERITA